MVFLRSVVGLSLIASVACQGEASSVGDATPSVGEDAGSAPDDAARVDAPFEDASTPEDTGVDAAVAEDADVPDVGDTPDASTPDTGVPGECPPGLSTSEWTRRADLPRARGEHANAVVDGRLITLGGIHDHRTGPMEVESYDPATNSWSSVSSLPELRNHFTTGHAVYAGEIWVCGGKPDGARSEGSTRVDVYNVAADSWRRGPDLPEDHWAGPAVVVGDSLHVVSGGINNRESADHHFVLDLRDEDAGWTRAADVPEARVHVAGVPYDGKLWLIGGEFHHRHDGDTATVQIYDPATDRWSSGPSLPEARSHHEWATFAHGGSIWSVSGVDSANRPRGQETIYRFDGTEWRRMFDLPGKLVSPGAKIMDGVLYVFGGGVNDWFGGDLQATWARCL